MDINAQKGSTNVVYLPGDVLPISTSKDEKDALVLGPGVYRSGEILFCTRAGHFRSTKRSLNVWIDGHATRYVPIRGDKVIGVVTGKAGEAFKVEIGSADMATVSFLSFEGATKRNKPSLKTGDLIFCQVLVASRDMEPELVCVDGEGKARGMGLIPSGGFVFKSSLNLIRKLLSKTTILRTIGEHMKFEVTLGMNGRIWVKGGSHRETVALVSILQKSELLADEQVDKLIKDTVHALRNH